MNEKLREILARKEPDAETNRLSEQIIGAAIEVHKALGPGFAESVYENALSVELNVRNIPFRCQEPITLKYKDRVVGKGEIDLLVADKIIVELKSVESLAAVHKAQVISYLKAKHLQVGLIINFNVPVLVDGVKRVILS
jgi:GxxExxY protein